MSFPSRHPWVAVKTAKGFSIENEAIAIASIPYSDATAEYDARLIAAAPDLLEALTFLVDMIEGSWSKHGFNSDEIVRCKVAIAKATQPAIPVAPCIAHALYNEPEAA